MSCQIFRSPVTNEVMTVLADNGKDSILFNKLSKSPDIPSKEIALQA